MRYTEFKVGDKEYKLRLSTNEIVNIEKKIGSNVLKIFMDKDNIPTMEQLMLVLHGALQKFHHNITLKDVYDIYDEYVDNGGTFEGLIEIILDVFEVAGFFKEEDLKKAKSNAK